MENKNDSENLGAKNSNLREHYLFSNVKQKESS